MFQTFLPDGRACNVTSNPSFFRSTGFRALSSLSSAHASMRSSAAKRAVAVDDSLPVPTLSPMGISGACAAHEVRKLLSFLERWS